MQDSMLERLLDYPVIAAIKSYGLNNK